MLRTVSIPVNLPSQKFFELQAQCAEIFNAHIDWALEQKTYNKSRAHPVGDVDYTQGIGFEAEDVKCNDGKEYDIVLDDNFAITSRREDVD